MFGLTGLIYVRDYVQGLQGQRSPTVSAGGNDEQYAQDLLGLRELPDPKIADEIKENRVVEALSVKLGSFAADASSSPRSYRNNPPGVLELHQGKCYFQNRVRLVPNGNDSNPPHLFCDLAVNNRSQHTTAHSEPYCSPGTDRGLALQQVSLASSQETTIKSTVCGVSLQSHPPSQKSLPSLPAALRNSNRPSSTITQSGSRLRRLSPLRESSGNINCSTEIEQRRLVVGKAREGANPVSQASKLSDKLSKPIVRKRSLQSILSPRSSIAEDSTNIPTFLGRYRTPSSPELRGAQTNPLYQSQSLFRASSFGSLRHLPPDRERTLYIGVNNNRLLLPQKPKRSITPAVTYRPTLHEERRTPSMTPFAIIGPVHSNKLPIAMSSTALTGAQPTSELGSAGVTRRNSSDVSIAGSMASDSDLTLVGGGEGNSENPHQSIPGSFFDDLSVEIRQLRANLAVQQYESDSDSISDELSIDGSEQDSIVEQLDENSIPGPMLPMMSTFQVQPSQPHVNGDSTYYCYYEFSSSMSLSKFVAFTSEAVDLFDNELFQETEITPNVSGNQIRLAQFENSVPIAGRRSSTVPATPPCSRSIITMSSKKPKGFWAKIGDLFKGCFGAD